MELEMYIIIPRTTNIEHLNLKVEQFEWDGRLYPQGFPQSVINTNWIIEDAPEVDYLINLLPQNLSKSEWRWLYVKGDGLEDFVTKILINNVETDALFEIFAKTLNDAAKWVVFCEIDNNPIIHQYNESITVLKENIIEKIIRRESFLVHND